MDMNFHAMRMMANQRMAEDRKWAARCRLAGEADRARREAQHSAGSPLAGLLRCLAGAARFRRPVLTASARAAISACYDSALRALADAAAFPGMM
jgi:hypothetical protein